MIGLTDREKDLAVQLGGPVQGFLIGVAELYRWCDDHRDGAFTPSRPSFNIPVTPLGRTDGERIAAVEDVARWLGVAVAEKDGCYRAQREFGWQGAPVLLEAHFHPVLAQSADERLAAIHREVAAMGIPARGRSAA